MQIEQNYFSLFGIPESFQPDLARVSECYRALQMELHPDRHAQGSERDKLLAAQYAAHLNDGLATLKSPLKRAMYLLQLRGHPIEDGDRRPMAPAFLMRQMELREALEEAVQAADPEAEVVALDTLVMGERKSLEMRFQQLLEAGSEALLLEAADCVRELQFLDKMQREIELLEERLTDF